MKYTSFEKFDASQRDTYDRLQKHLQKWQKWSFFPKKPYGIYLYGPSGSGKTTLMDMLYTNFSKHKKRQHLKPFMMDLHKNGFNATIKSLKGIRLLCLDEMEITDIADAMILGRFLGKCAELKIYIFFTSNFKPCELYKNGLNRERFLSTIAYLERNYLISELNHGMDYRHQKREKERREESFLNTALENMERGESLSAKEADTILSKIFEFYETFKADAITSKALFTNQDLEPYILKQNTQQNDKSKSKDTLNLCVIDQTIPVSNIHNNTATVNFEDIFYKPLGPRHYRWLATRLECLYIENMQPFCPETMDGARRFVTAVDFFYDLRKKIIFKESFDLKIYFKPLTEQVQKRLISRLLSMGNG